ncbi:uncharacterized protein [Lolium perenne]|uniref:uncharacterized protein n=1 Tax=Lolium perenne TaxID=4522 RepID=UPI0021F686D5|nr:uncharacterized protein LOC127346765 [Lolium perenne]
MGLQYTVQYKKGVLNGAADALSRKPVHSSPLMVATVVQPDWLDKVVDSYKDDSYTSQLIQKLIIDPQCDPLFSLSKGVLRYQGRIWIGPDKELQHTIISAFHDSPVGGQVMRYLLDHGGDPAMPDEMGSTPLHFAAVEGHCEAARLLLSKGVPVDLVNYCGAPLHIAAFNDHVEVVKVLLEHAADLNKVSHHFASPLLLACSAKSLKCIKLLIEVGADVNAPPGYPASAPLIQAVKNGLTEIVKLLLEAGADPNTPNMGGI